MPKVSLFPNVGTVTSPTHYELEEYLEMTRECYWWDIVKAIRECTNEDEKKKLKQAAPTCTLSGHFDYRSDSNIIKHSTILAMDLDDVEDIPNVRKKLEKDTYVYSCFLSTSGTGLRVLFFVEPKKHKQAFIGIVQYLFDKYGITSCDLNGKNVSKPYIVSADAKLYLNLDETPVFKKYITETVIKNTEQIVHTSADFDSIVNQISKKHIQICDDYLDWMRCGMAIASQFGEDGRSAFHKISEVVYNYDFKTTEDQYKHCLRAHGAERANIATFYFLAKSHGINITSEQTRKITRTTRNGKKAGLKPQQIIDNLKKFDGIEGADDVVNKIFESNEEESEEESILFQLEMYISNNFNLRMNEVTGYAENNSQPLTPSDMNSIFISAKKVCPRLDYQLLVRLIKSDFIESYNPFYEFLGSDGLPTPLPAMPKPNESFASPLIDKLAETIKNDNPGYTLFFLRKWIVSIISSMHKVHSPLLLCLLGAQNSGKTEFFRRLLPKEFQVYYAESKLDKGKDDELLMTENIIIMDDELGGKSKQDADKLKNITSQQWFSIRRPYGDHNEKILRLAVLCGTSNYKNVLNDPTGNRRIIPIDVTDIDKELYNGISKQELFKEAYSLYRQGFDWRITAIDIPFLNQNQIEYEKVIKERELISKYFEVPKEGEESIMLMSTEVLVEINKLTNEKLNINVIGREMEYLGFKRKAIREGDKIPKKWNVRRTGRSEAIFTNTGENRDIPF